jgi:diguanylate cyclase (GGDEF)-like protein
MKKKNWVIILSTVLVFAIVTLTTVISFRETDNRVKEYCFNKLQATSKSLANELNNESKTDQTLLAAISSTLSAQVSLDDDTIINLLGSFSLTSSCVSFLEYLSSDNILYNKEGIMDKQNILLFENEEYKAPYLSGKEYLIEDSNKCIVRSSYPVKKENNTIGILYGIILLEELPQKITTNLYQNQANVYLVDCQTGDFLLDTWHDTLGNLYDLGSRKMTTDKSFDEFLDDLKYQKSGYIGFISETTKEILYLSYQPTYINDLAVLVSVTKSVALNEENSINKIKNLVIWIQTLVLVLYMTFIVLWFSRINHKLELLGLMDLNTGLLNRNAFNGYLAEQSKKKFESITCIYMDANHLHEVNNQYGHDTGDKMLQEISASIKGVFSKEKCFRIGGDEFILFTLISEEKANERMKEIENQLEKNNYSISYGIVQLKNEQGLERITHIADGKMLENKKKFYHNLQERDLRN